MTSRDNNDAPNTNGEIVDVPSTEVRAAEPESLKVRSWNPAKEGEARRRLAESNIPWTDDPTDEWVAETQRQLRKNGDVQFANQLKSYVVRKNPALDRPLGREQQEKSARAARQQEQKQNRNTVPNARNQRVAKKRPMTLLIGGTLLGLLLLSGVGYGGYSAYKQSAADAAARQSAQAAQETQAATPIQQVDPADPNQIIDTSPTQGAAVGSEGAATDTGTTDGSGSAADGTGTAGTPPSGDSSSQPTSTISPPPDTEALQQRYEQGKRDGQVSGYSAGQGEGYAKGKTEGQQAGFSQGRTQGQQEGYGQGQAEGQQQGYRAGQQAAQAQRAQGSGAAGTGAASTAAAPSTRVTLTPVPSSQVVPVTSGIRASSGSSVPSTAGTQTATSTQSQPAPGKLTFTATGSGSNSGEGAARLSFAGSAGTQGAGSTQNAAGSGAAGGNGGGGATSGATAPGRGSFELRTAPDTASSTRSTGLILNQGASPADSAASGSSGTGAASGSASGTNGGRLVLLSAGSSQGNGESAGGSASSTGTSPGSTGSEEVQFGNVTLVVPSGSGAGSASSSSVSGRTAAATGTNNAGGSAGTPGTTAQQSGAGTADTAAVNFGPYRPYQTVNARLQTASLILENSAVNLPVIAVSSDGRKWIGTGKVIGAQRVNLQFTQMVDLDGKTVLTIPAAAYDASGVPGVQGSGQDLAPDLVRNLLRNAASGVRDYAQAQLSATTTTVAPNGSVIVQKAAPTLWTVVGGRALSVFDLPTNAQTFTRATYLPAGTPLVLVVGATQQQSAQPGR